MSFNLRVMLVGPGKRTGTLAGVPVTVLFSNPAEVSDIGAAGAMINRASCWLPTEDVPVAWMAAQLVIAEGTFKCTQHVPDSVGGSVLYLDKVHS
jgi:hypothetical protein